MNLPDVFAAFPAVYAVGNEYQIFVPVTCETLMWVKVGDECYYDDSNGILRSGSPTHRMTVPMEELDAAGGYTICFRRVQERLPYYSKTGEIEKYPIPFRPVRGDTIHLYHIADTHNMVESPVKAGSYFGDKLDLLILNGDIPDHSGEIQNFTTIHNIAGQLTHGEIPTVFSRGNHDLRGNHAEDLPDHTPCRNGFSYYTFRLGALWGIVLDCGEDKLDCQVEYGNTIACHAFRKRETAYLRSVIRHASEEYEAEGVKYRMVLSHVPFSYNQEDPFNIEIEEYTLWCKLLKENVKPDVMLCGHLHRMFISHAGSEWDSKGQPCPVVVASKPDMQAKRHAGGAIVLSPDGIDVRFTDDTQTVLYQETLPLASR